MQTQDRQEGRSDRIVVGYDGSGHADEALKYALAEGARRSAPVQVVLAVEPPEEWAYTYYGVPPLPDAGEARERARKVAAEQVDAFRRTVDATLQEVRVDVVAMSGSPTAVLPEVAKDAALLVVGHRGRGAVRSTLLGSVGLSAVLHAPCPVTVVPSPTDTSAAGATAADGAERLAGSPS